MFKIRMSAFITEIFLILFQTISAIQLEMTRPHLVFAMFVMIALHAADACIGSGCVHDRSVT